MSDPSQQLLRLSAVLGLLSRARKTSVEELGFLMVNETMQAVNYRQAVFWSANKGVLALSGVPSVERGAPYVNWVTGLIKGIKKKPDLFNSMHLVDITKISARAQKDWREWMPEHLLWCPVQAVKGPILGGLFFAREEPWDEGDVQVLGVLVESYAQSLLVASLPKAPKAVSSRGLIKAFTAVSMLVGLGFLGFMPIRATVLAPAEIVPSRPTIVRVPFVGIIDTILVAPNSLVEKDQIVARLDKRQLATQYEVAVKTLESAKAEYQQASQEAMMDPKARARAGLLRNKIEEQEAEKSYREQLLGRSEIHSPVAGVAVYDDPSDWVGKPVEPGERIMLISPPMSSRLEIKVPVNDAVQFDVNSEVTFFDDVAPDKPTDGKVVFASYGSSMTAEGVLSYTLRADLNPQAPLRLGLKGTAKVFGPPRPLVLWILRKPINTVRQWLSL